MTILALFFLIVPVLSAGFTNAQGPYDHLETSVIWGRVLDTSGKPCANFEVSLEADLFIGKKVLTDENGWYSVNLSSGTYTVRVHCDLKQELGRTEVSLGEGETKRIDFKVDPRDPPKSRLYGVILDRWGQPVEKARITLMRGEPYTVNTTRSDKEGHYSLFVPSGTYNLTVLFKDNEELNRTISLQWQEEREFNISIESTGERIRFDLLKIAGFLEENWIYILFMLISVLVLFGLYEGSIISVRSLRRRRIPLIEDAWYDHLLLLLKRSFVVLILTAILWQISNMSEWIENVVWGPGLRVALHAIGVFLVMFLMRISLRVNDIFWERLRERLEKKDKPSFFLRVFTMVTLITRYSILAMWFGVIVLLVLSALGLGESMADAALGFLSDNIAQLSFLGILVVAGFILKKFIDIAFKELEARTTRLSPAMVRMTHKGILTGIYAILGMIFVFTLLSMAGLGDVGTTFILVISMIIGLVVSFAATGSIGNMLSGLVIMSMKPFDTGDRVNIGERTLGDIVYMGLMFTRVRDLEGRLIEIPNNNVLANNITNFSRTASEGSYAVFVDVTLGYEIHPKRAKTLMKHAAMATSGVLDDPPPHVLLRAFHDHAVEYRLRAFINEPHRMLFIRSSVMENMLDMFHQNGLEILSPLYHVKREGRDPTHEQLEARTQWTREQGDSSAQTLSMFDGLENGSYVEQAPAPDVGGHSGSGDLGV
ncbi:MAG: mechanosensitive ion channel [Candidatus Thermoplasmatota archaeon]|nr:mechanosensitive ion channel [Candidatus Thermoplasmatota archaeon]